MSFWSKLRHIRIEKARHTKIQIIFQTKGQKAGHLGFKVRNPSRKRECPAKSVQMNYCFHAALDT
jgi:hypothetical protein